MIIQDDVDKGIGPDHQDAEDAPTLGEIADLLRPLKKRGVHRGSILYVIDQVWWEDEQRAEAGR